MSAATGSPDAAARFAWACVSHKQSPVMSAAALTWAEIVALLTAHRVGTKEGPGWLPAAIEPGPRTGERVESVSLLSLDIEADTENVKLDDGREGKRLTGPLPPPLLAMAAELELWGLAGVLATSHSHEGPTIDGGTLGPRYRLVMPVSRTLTPAEVRPLCGAVSAMLGVADSVDQSCFEPARLFYLPRCPADRLHLAEAREVQGRPLDVDALLKAARAAKAPKQAPAGAGPKGASVIDAFNKAHDIGAILESHGYEAAGRNRYKWPGSSTGVAGVVTLPESGRCFSHHAQDPLREPEHGRDTFGAWCVLAHGGDVSAAVREAARLLGMGNATAPGGAPAGQPPPLDRAEAVKRARELLAPALRDREAPAYPLAALGPLAEVCEAIATHGQVQPAMAGQCVLGAASLLTQGLWNVETLAGRRPLSLDLCTLGDSGDGKTTAQGVALGPVHEWQRREGDAFRAEVAEFERAKATRKKGDDPPEAPPCPYRLIRDATVEGLRRDLDTGPCSQGIFTDEAAAILSGYGMSAEHRSKTAGVFSGLWDSGHLSVSRATGPRVERYGRRVALHWLIQPMAAAEALGDPMLSALGFWPRFLAAWPAPLAPRLARSFKPDALPAVGAYWKRCAELLAELLPEDADDCPVIALGDDARDLLGRAFERFEVEARRGALRPVKPFALRATEQACRVAGVLAAFGGHRTIGTATARDALALVAYSLETWRAIVDEGATDPTAAHALRLYEWLTARPGWRERLAVIVKDGPPCVRSKDKRDAALGLLIEHKLAELSDGDAHALAPAGGKA